MTIIKHPLTSLTEHLFNLKFAAKELHRNSKRCDKEERAEKSKVKQVGLLKSVFTGSRDTLGYSAGIICIMFVYVLLFLLFPRLSRKVIWKQLRSMQRMPSVRSISPSTS